MNRRPQRLLAAAGLAAAALAAPAASPASAAPVPRAGLAAFECHHALQPVDRSVSVVAVMRPRPGTRTLEVRFDLLERLPGQARAMVVHGQRLGVWVLPTDPTLGRLPGDVWRLYKPVINLPAPAAYRFRVRFRWLGDGGRVLGSSVRFTRACRQPELRPDLLVRSISVAALPARPADDLYTVAIANRGATGAGPFEVLFTPSATGSPIARVVRFLRAHRARTLSFTGPACDPLSPPTVTVDAAEQTDDYDRSNNTLAAVCPASGGG
ncbi:MAG: hypothetical protein ACRDMJ_03285 [Solirubrobacteraceae bacterium]